MSKNQILRDVSSLGGIDERRRDYDFFGSLKLNKVKTKKTQQKQLRDVFGNVSEDAPIVYLEPTSEGGKRMGDTNLNDMEKIPMKQDVEAYFECEVLTFASDAWMDRSKDKVGCEFPYTRLFYKYRPLRSSDGILAELMALEKEADSGLARLKQEE